MKKSIRNTFAEAIIFSAVILLSPLVVGAQDPERTNYERDALITAAKEMMATSRYCALITLDPSGYPQVRTMDPFSPDEDMVVWLGTNKNSRKAMEIRHDSRVSLYYEAPNGAGYVAIQGNACLVDDPDKMVQYWKEEWDGFYPDKNSTYTLIRVVPKKIEIIDYEHGITGSSKTWTVPNVEF